jgi:hypothetical protein
LKLHVAEFVIGSFGIGAAGRSHTNKLSLDPIETEASFADGFAHPSVTKAEKPRIDAVILTIPGSIPKSVIDSIVMDGEEAL